MWRAKKDPQPSGDGGPAPALEARGLTRRYGARVAVDRLDLVVPRGEIYGCLGPNGAGKSSLVRMCCTLLRPSAGRVRVAGRDVVTEPQEVRARIGVALQEAALDEGQTGRELLVLQGRLHGLRPARIRTRVAEVLDLVDIGSALDRRIATYSGGMRRRLDLAAALVHRPEILFLDEPTTGLDPEHRAAVWAEVRRLNTEVGMTVFLTTQYLEEADALAHRVGIITAGRLAAEGSPAELKAAHGRHRVEAEVDGDVAAAVAVLRRVPALAAATAGNGAVVVHAPDGAAAAPAVVAALAGAGTTVRRLTVRTPSLDDVFASVTAAGRAGVGREAS